MENDISVLLDELRIPPALRDRATRNLSLLSKEELQAMIFRSRERHARAQQWIKKHGRKPTSMDRVYVV